MMSAAIAPQRRLEYPIGKYVARYKTPLLLSLYPDLMVSVLYSKSMRKIQMMFAYLWVRMFLIILKVRKCSSVEFNVLLSFWTKQAVCKYISRRPSWVKNYYDNYLTKKNDTFPVDFERKGVTCQRKLLWLTIATNLVMFDIIQFSIWYFEYLFLNFSVIRCCLNLQ